MPSIAFLVPGSIHSLTGGSIYGKRMADGLRARGWTVDVRELATPGDAEAVLSTCRDGTTVVVDGLIFGVVPGLVERQTRLRLLALVHLPLAEEPGLSNDAARALELSERRSLAVATRVMVTGATTIETLARYGVQRDRITLVEPGTDRAPLAHGSGSSTQHLLCVATLNPGKGHEILVRALAANAGRRWHLTCVGSLDRYPATVERVRAAIRSFDLEHRVTMTGECSGKALEARYARADAFVLATQHETYGMAVADALARGLPVISTTTGAIPSLVGDDAGVLVAPRDANALTTALARFLDDEALRDRLRAGAQRARSRLRSWDTAVDEMAAALR